MNFTNIASTIFSLSGQAASAMSGYSRFSAEDAGIKGTATRISGGATVVAAAVSVAAMGAAAIGLAPITIAVLGAAGAASAGVAGFAAATSHIASIYSTSEPEGVAATNNISDDSLADLAGEPAPLGDITNL